MTKKHFIALADAIKAANTWAHDTDANQPFKNSTCQALADFCAQQNPRFNRERWLGYIAGALSKNGRQL